MTIRRPIALLALLLLVACSDPGKALERVRQVQDGGDDAATETALREALERHPEDLELLLVAADFYIRPEAEDYYRPRLSLHYAMRADEAASYQDSRATRAMVKAHRGAGGFDETDALVRHGLAGVGHPDAEDPVRLEPVDPDLIEPTLPNFVEQRRRQTDGRPTLVCGVGLMLVPEAQYLDGLAVKAFCVEERGRPVAADCGGLELRACTTDEAAVVQGPVAGLLSGDGERCCADPTLMRVTADGRVNPLER